MKYKLTSAAALILLIAAGCSSNQSGNNNQQLGTSQSQNNIPMTPPPAPTPSPTPKPSPQPAPDGNNIQVIGIDITSNGFSPANVTIHKNDYVQFTNKDVDLHWPASNPHPIHNGYPGFDALKGLQQGQKYRFQFTKIGSWGYHDHLNPSWGGTITVVQ